MKKIFVLALISAFCVGAWADWLYHSATQATYIDTYSYTNRAIAPVRIAGLDCRYVSAATGDVKVYRVRGSISNLLNTFTMVGGTSLSANSDEFSGAYFVQADIIRIVDETSVTNRVILNLEQSTF